MSLRHAHPDREDITNDTVVFDDLTDVFVLIKSVMPDSIAEKKNGVGWDTLVDSFVSLSNALSRFEYADISAYATDYAKRNDALIAEMDLLRWRCSQSKTASASASITGSEHARGHASRCNECIRAMMRFKHLAAMMRSRVTRRRAELNREWREAKPLREQRRKEEEDRRAASKEERRRRNSEEWRRLNHDRFERDHGIVGTG